MGKKYSYTWKQGGSSNRSIDFKQPLLEGTVFVDLLSGKAYRVHSLYKAKENDRAFPEMPEDVVQTLEAKSLSEEELLALRVKHRFELYDGIEPGYEFAIL